MIHLIDGSFGIVKESFYKGGSSLYLYISYYEQKRKQRTIQSILQNAINHYGDRIEVKYHNFIITDERMVLPDLYNIHIKFPIKIYTQHEMRCKRYVDSFLYTFVNDYKK